MRKVLAFALAAILCVGMLPATAASKDRENAREVSEEEQEADKYYRTGDTTPPVQGALATTTDANAFADEQVEPNIDTVDPYAERDAAISEGMKLKDKRYVSLADADLDAFVRAFTAAQADVIVTQTVPDFSKLYDHSKSSREMDMIQAEFFAYRQALEIACPDIHPIDAKANITFQSAVSNGNTIRVSYYTSIEYTQSNGATGGFGQRNVLYVVPNGDAPKSSGSEDPSNPGSPYRAIRLTSDTLTFAAARGAVARWAASDESKEQLFQREKQRSDALHEYIMTKQPYEEPTAKPKKRK